MNKIDAKTVDVFSSFLNYLNEDNLNLDKSIKGDPVSDKIKENSINKGVIGHIGGIGADSNEPTRNGRRYPIELWEKVEQSEYFKEGMETRTIIGEADHPDERLDYSVKEGAVILTKYEIDKNKGTVYTEFDILDTLPGRTVKTYFDAGCNLGVSSRGLGEEVMINGEKVIDSESYQFYCFDVVAFPAVKSARMELIESTSGKKESLIKSITKEINNCTTLDEVKFIESMSKGVNLYLDEIKEAIKMKLNILKETDYTSKDLDDLVKKGHTIEVKFTDDNDKEQVIKWNDIKIDGPIIKDNEKVEQLLNDLKKECLNENEVALVKSENDNNNKIKISGENLESDEDTIDSRENPDNKDLEILNELEEEIKNLNKQILQKNEVIKKLSAVKYSNSLTLKTQNESIISLKESQKFLNEILKEDKLLKKELDTISKKYEKLHKVNKEFSNIVSVLKEQIETKTKENNLLNEHFKILENENRKLINTNLKLNESIKSEKINLKQTLTESTNKFQNELKSLKDENSELKQINEKLEKTIEIVKNEKDEVYHESLDKYILMMCNRYNLNESTLRRLLGDTYNTSDIDKIAKELVENNNKIKALPFAHLKPDRQIFVENIGLHDMSNNDETLDTFKFMVNTKNV